MSWLDRIEDRATRRIARLLLQRADQTRDLAGAHLQRFARQAGPIVDRTAHELADYGRHEGSIVARMAAERALQAHRAVQSDQFQDLLHQAGATASRVAHDLANYGRHEGAVVSRAAAARALRAGRALQADPLPAVVGAVGLVLLANLLFGRRRA